ncbi:hypothetical protein NE865_10775 [Phthorimaea operculella]|nr:hypothetical protein NE865_10775 [Phthorimaea operculella]
MEFTEDPFKDYRYEDPFNIDDPFSDVTDAKKIDPFARPTSVAGFETDDFFPAASSTVNGNFTLPEKRSGRVSAPPVPYDPFSSRSDFNSEFKTTPNNKSNNNDSWAAWPNDSWAAEDAWSKPAHESSFSKNDNRTSSKTDAWSGNTKSASSEWKTDNWANKTDNWATDWSSDQNKNLNETWPSQTLPSKKEKSPKPVKYAKSLVHTIGGIGRNKHNKEKKDKSKGSGTVESKSVEFLPTEEQQIAWAAAESKRLEQAAEARRRQEDAELQLALAISRQEK